MLVVLCVMFAVSFCLVFSMSVECLCQIIKSVCMCRFASVCLSGLLLAAQTVLLVVSVYMFVMVCISQGTPGKPREF